MGFKTGKTIGDLNMVDTLKELINDKDNVMIVEHPNGEGFCVQSSVLTDAKNQEFFNLAVNDKKRIGVLFPVMIPVANLANGQLAGHSVFLDDSFGNRTQISFLVQQMVDLEKLSIRDDGAPFVLCMDMALDELGDDEALNLWIFEIGLYDLEDDPRTPYQTAHVAVAAETATEARGMAEDLAQDTISVRGNVRFWALGDPEKANPDDYQN